MTKTINYKLGTSNQMKHHIDHQKLEMLAQYFPESRNTPFQSQYFVVLIEQLQQRTVKMPLQYSDKSTKILEVSTFVINVYKLITRNKKEEIMTTLLLISDRDIVLFATSEALCHDVQDFVINSHISGTKIRKEKVTEIKKYFKDTKLQAPRALNYFQC